MTDEWAIEVFNIYTMEYNLAARNDEILQCAVI